VTIVHQKKPVSKDLIDIILGKLRDKKLIPGMIGIKRGVRPGELIFLTTEGNVPCIVERRDCFICFVLPSGRVLGVPEQEILKSN
jgi:hypothetical protein